MVEKCFGSVQPIRQIQIDELPSGLIEDIPEVYGEYEHYSDLFLTQDEKRRIRKFVDDREKLQDSAKEVAYDCIGVHFTELKLKGNIASHFGKEFIESRTKQRPALKIGNSSALQPTAQTGLAQPNLVSGWLKPVAQPEETNIYEQETQCTVSSKELSASGVPTSKCVFVTEDTGDALNSETRGTISVKPRDIVFEYVKSNVSEGIIDLKQQKYDYMYNHVICPSRNTIAPPFIQQLKTASVEHTIICYTDSNFSNTSAQNISIRTRKRVRARSNTDAPPCKRPTLQALERKLRQSLQPLDENYPEQNIRKNQNKSLLPCFDELLR